MCEGGQVAKAIGCNPVIESSNLSLRFFTMLKLFNTLTREKQDFKPIIEGKVGMYTCGPTVYNFAHIGNYKAYISADLLKRYLKYKGLEVKQVMNITDVDDKTIRDSQKEGVSLSKFTEKYEKAFFEDIKTLNIDTPEVFPKATEHIKVMIALVKKLLDKEFAYKGEDGSIYFNIRKFKEYGKLSKVKLDELKPGARVNQDEYTKDQAQDFVLWKAWDKDDGAVFWETEIGKGRPGWHLECSAMSMKYLGDTFDIHTGGIDLIFPHHENEIAQSEASTGKKFVNYWFHNEWILSEGKKMGKRYNNFFTLRDLADKGFDPMAIRYALIVTHYRQQLNLTLENIKSAEKILQRFYDFLDKLESIKSQNDNPEVESLVKSAKEKFDTEMDNDLNVSSAMATIFELMTSVNKLIMEEKISKKDAKQVIDTIHSFDKVLGILKRKEVKIPEEIKTLAEKRQQARKDKNFELADKIRYELKQKGFIIEDTKDGLKIKQIK